jgi:hypothetical protein
MRIMLSVDEVLEVDTLTREEFRRLRDWPVGCEICGKPLARRQKRFCSTACCCTGARRSRGGDGEQTVRWLVDRLLGVAGVSDVQVTFRGARLSVGTQPKGEVHA